MSTKGIAGAISQIEAAQQSGDTQAVADVAAQLRRDVADLYKRVIDTLEAQAVTISQVEGLPVNARQGVLDQVETFKRDLGEFAPVDPDDGVARPNPALQPGDPNPMAAAELANREQAAAKTDESKAEAGAKK